MAAGVYAVVDAIDCGLVSGHAWSLDPKGRYAVAYTDLRDVSRRVWMHRLIMNPQPHEVVDHIDGDGLNNQRSNLRVCSKAENGRNRRKQRTRAATASRFKGVSWDITNMKWRARIVLGGKQRSLGSFHCEQQAAMAYDAAALEHFGRFACTNDDLGLYERNQPPLTLYPRGDERYHSPPSPPIRRRGVESLRATEIQ